MQEKKNKISIIFPVYNEEKALPKILDEWRGVLEKNKISSVFILCEDGSTDQTRKTISTLRSKLPIVTSYEDKRSGYSKAVMRGIKAAKTDYVLCVDSDGQCDPKDVVTFWRQRKSFDVVRGYRYDRKDGRIRKIYSAIFKLLYLFLFQKNLKDPSCPYVLFEKKKISKFLQYLPYTAECFWWGFSGCISRYELSFKEIPINHRKRFKGITQTYTIREVPFIFLRNIIGLIKISIESKKKSDNK